MTPSGESVSPQSPRFGTELGETALCGACGRTVKVSGDGTLWRHWRGTEPPCPGSERKPEDIVGDVYERAADVA
jgi:hypothetical protein